MPETPSMQGFLRDVIPFRQDRCHTPLTAASVSERPGGQPVLQKLHQKGQSVARVYLVWADGDHSSPSFLPWVMAALAWIVHVVLLKKRWIVERTFG